MTEIIDLVEEIKSFLLFEKISDNLLNFKRSLRSKIWTKEILTNHLNKFL